MKNAKTTKASLLAQIERKIKRARPEVRKSLMQSIKNYRNSDLKIIAHSAKVVARGKGIVTGIR
jgi:hypothetical protein